MENQGIKDALLRYIHPVIAEDVAKLLIQYKVALKIKAPRKTKLGDYRNPRFNGQHQITINGDLNPYSFAITLLHELAHMLCYERYQSKVKPHGKEWKSIFKVLAKPYLSLSIFPVDVLDALKKYFLNPGASSCADPNLYKILNRYNKTQDLYLEDIPDHSHFKLPNGRAFEKGQRKRTRYLCKCLTSGKIYSVSAVAKIERII